MARVEELELHAECVFLLFFCPTILTSLFAQTCALASEVVLTSPTSLEASRSRCSEKRTTSSSTLSTMYALRPLSFRL